MARGSGLINEEVNGRSVISVLPTGVEPMTSQIQLDILSTELWKTRNEQGRKLGSYRTYGLLIA